MVLGPSVVAGTSVEGLVSQEEQVKKRISRKRPTAIDPLNTEFEINFKLKVSKPGVTEKEVQDYITECVRYASAAFVFYMRHPVGGTDTHKRKKHSNYVGLEDVTAKAIT